MPSTTFTQRGVAYLTTATVFVLHGPSRVAQLIASASSSGDQPGQRTCVGLRAVADGTAGGGAGSELRAAGLVEGVGCQQQRQALCVDPMNGACERMAEQCMAFHVSRAPACVLPI